MIDKIEISQQVAIALREESGTGDVTAALISEKSRSEAKVISREPAIRGGLAGGYEGGYQLDPKREIEW